MPRVRSVTTTKKNAPKVTPKVWTTELLLDNLKVAEEAKTAILETIDDDDNDKNLRDLERHLRDIFLLLVKLLNEEIDFVEFLKQNTVLRDHLAASITKLGYCPNLGETPASGTVFTAIAMMYYATFNELGYKCLHDIHNKLDPKNPCLRWVYLTLKKMIVYEATGDWHDFETSSVAIVDMLPLICDKACLDEFVQVFVEKAKVPDIIVRCLGLALFATKVVCFYVTHDKTPVPTLIASYKAANDLFNVCDSTSTILICKKYPNGSHLYIYRNWCFSGTNGCQPIYRHQST